MSIFLILINININIILIGMGGCRNYFREVYEELSSLGMSCINATHTPK